MESSDDVAKFLASYDDYCNYHYPLLTKIIKKEKLDSQFNSFVVLIINISMSAMLSDMRRDVQEIFRSTPHGKQVMMFSATLSKDIRPVCKKFMQDVISQTSSLQTLNLITPWTSQSIHPGESSDHDIIIVPAG